MAIQVNGTTVIDNSRNLTNIGTVAAISYTGDGSGLTGIGGATYSSTAPSNPSNGALWLNSSSGFLYIRSEDEWVSVGFYGTGNQVNGGSLFYPNSFDYRVSTFTVPADVYDVSVVAIGQGAANYSSDGCGGGGLVYKNNIAVEPGDVFTVKFNESGATRVEGNGIDIKAFNGVNRIGGGYSGGDGGGNGGNGGINYYSGSLYAEAGSGGAGGYGGNGGNGADGYLSDQNGTNGSNGAGAGGGNLYDTQAGSGYSGGKSGGGTSVYGEGSSGLASDAPGTNFSGTKDLSADHSGSVDILGLPGPSTVDYIAFGAGDRVGYAGLAGVSFPPQTTRLGGVRFVWSLGGTQAFPSTDVGPKLFESFNVVSTTSV